MALHDFKHRDFTTCQQACCAVKPEHLKAIGTGVCLKCERAFDDHDGVVGDGWPRCPPRKVTA